ncbi:MAG: RNA-binding transcriptional accessory protein [Porticoccaceae bacterium]|nr:RNA-binding transcriptional accessory protein [Porticoccaceae bacterium]
MQSIASRIASELQVGENQVTAAIQLLDEGATVPFISRYRKEVTGGLDDTQMRSLEERLNYIRELEDRRKSILASIEEQGKLTPELKQAINLAETKTRLEDLYLPFKVKRRTKGQIAIEAGLEPLADSLYSDPSQNPEQTAAAFVNPELGIADTKAALDGAKFILMERFSEDAELLGRLRQFMSDEANITAALVSGKDKEPGKEQAAAKFKDYFEHSEPLNSTPSHRALAMFRARREGFISIRVDLITEEGLGHPCESMIARQVKIENLGRPADEWLAEVVRWTWRIKLHTHLETDLLGSLRERADLDAINVFSINLKDLILAAPAGQKATIGLDPGLRTGVKVAVVDSTGKLLDHTAIFPTAPQRKTHEAEAILTHFCEKYQVQLIAIGNGTGSRETESFVLDMLKNNKALKAQAVMVNEAGASIYSASEFAAKEFPDLDVTIRGAVSIARRLQDPLAELVKIDPKSIGVGQYQHDVSQVKLARSLDTVIEDCVNAVGVEVNTASSALLRRVSGLSQTIADNIVDYRDQQGAFKSREQLKLVSRFGERTFEQAAGFLRIANADNPLDASAVHPETYSVVERIAEANKTTQQALVGNSQLLRKLDPANYVDTQFGLPTITDILSELDKPGRDPRPEFKTATFKEGIETIKDLAPAMLLEGVVTNVTNFGAFVDVGVHQDGLVHISAIANRFVKDPHEVVKTGDIVKVKVMEVDVARKRIALSMRMDDEVTPAHSDTKIGTTPGKTSGKKPDGRSRGGPKPHNKNAKSQHRFQAPKPQAKGSMAALFEKALKKP